MNQQREEIELLVSPKDWPLLCDIPDPDMILRFIGSIPSECVHLGMQQTAKPYLRAALLSLYLCSSAHGTKVARQMLESREGALGALEHGDPVVRGTALWILREMWLNSSDMLPILLRVLEREPSRGVRYTALIIVARYYCGVGMDKRLRKQLAKVAIEKQRDRLERKMAYEMLLLASDRPFSELERFWRLYHKDPDNVDRFLDFSLLNDYLQGET
jgi:hypothetical protein